MKKRSLFAVLTVLLLVLGALAWQGLSQRSATLPHSMESVQAACFELDLPRTEAALEEVVASQATSLDNRLDALVFQARMAWKFYRDRSRAEAILARAETLRPKAYEPWALRSRVAYESGSWGKAIESAEQAGLAAETQAQRVEGATLLGRAIWGDARERIAEGKAQDEALLAKGASVLRAVLKTVPGYPEPSKLLLGLSLLRRDGASALWAWHSFFQLPGEESPQGVLARPHELLEKTLSVWQGRSLGREEGGALIEGLGLSRFYDLGKQVKHVFFADDGLGDAPLVSDMLHYADFIEQVGHSADAYYRAIALGRQDAHRFEAHLYRHAEDLWQKLSWPQGARDSFSKARLGSELQNRFGAHFVVGRTSNYAGTVLIMGHLVDEQRRTVTQYGYTSDFAFLSYDMMVSNGYSTWFWDGMASIGGWGTAESISEVRTGRVERQYRKWWRVRDPRERSRLEAQIAQGMGQEEQAIARDLSAGLELSAARMQQRALERMIAGIEAEGSPEEEIPMIFLKRYQAFAEGAHIFAHEGRHAIDQKFFAADFARWDNEEREYRAKLSEIVFSSDPCLALAGILSQGASSSGHGRANLRIRQVLSNWMTNHQAEIEGLDAAKPLLTQACLLRGEQIADCFTQADPLSGKP